MVLKYPKAPAGEPGGVSNRDHEIVLSALEFIARIAYPARYQWAKLIARVYEEAPLRCEHCGGSMKIIAFITKRREIKAILNY